MVDDDAMEANEAGVPPPDGLADVSHAQTAPWMRRKTDRIRTWNPNASLTEPIRPLQLAPTGGPPTGTAPQTTTPPKPGLGAGQPTATGEATDQQPAVGQATDDSPVGPDPSPDGAINQPPTPEETADVRALLARIEHLEEALEAMHRRTHKATERFARGAFELSLRVDQDVVRLGRRLAEAIVRRTVALDPTIVVGTLRAAFGLSGPLEKVTIRCAQADAPALREASEDLATELMGRWVEVAVQPSPDIEPGGLILLFDEGVVDARIPAQLDRLTEVVERALGAQSFEGSLDEQAHADAASPPDDAHAPPPKPAEPAPASDEANHQASHAPELPEETL